MTGAGKPTVYAIWNRLALHEGTIFRRKNGRPFTYELDGTAMIPDIPSRPRIGLSNFEAALPEVPCEGPAFLPKYVFGPSYVWAVLHDRRIRLADY